jgi:prostaglandin-endoperoxide synthase 2
LIESGLDKGFCAASAQKAAELGAFNTATALLPIEDLAVRQARVNRIQCYNSYRLAFGMARAENFEDITSSPAVAGQLRALYETTDDVEFYPGLFAEDLVKNAPLPELLLRMVAVDAFSQALTNPLLSEHVFNEATFTPWGFNLIHTTSSLDEILTRNVPARSGQPIIMTQADWKY